MVSKLKKFIVLGLALLTGTLTISAILAGGTQMAIAGSHN